MAKLASLVSKEGALALGASAVAAKFANSGFAAPDLRVVVRLNDDVVIQSPTVQDSTLASYGPSSSNCTVVPRSKYEALIRVDVIDADAVNDDPAGVDTVSGLSRDDLDRGELSLMGFDSVAQVDFTLDAGVSPCSLWHMTAVYFDAPERFRTGEAWDRSNAFRIVFLPSRRLSRFDSTSSAAVEFPAGATNIRVPVAPAFTVVDGEVLRANIYFPRTDRSEMTRGVTVERTQAGAFDLGDPGRAVIRADLECAERRPE